MNVRDLTDGERLTFRPDRLGTMVPRQRTMRLPGVCIDCRAPVVWDGKRWQDAPVGRGPGRAHHCGSIG